MAEGKLLETHDEITEDQEKGRSRARMYKASILQLARNPRQKSTGSPSN